MGSDRTNKRSEMLLDDVTGKTIVKRCFFLLCGRDDMSDFLEIENKINVFKAPRDPFRIEFKLNVHNIIVEICNDVVNSQTQLIPEFKSFFRYQDLTDCKEDLKMKIDLHSTLYLVRK